jgi:RNA polymerase sigma factor (sigma-70 family)
MQESAANERSAVTLNSLAARLSNGDETVLEEITRAYAPAVRALLGKKYRGLQNAEDLEDVLAIALFRLWQGRRHYQPEKSSLPVWFFRIAENVVRDVLRSGWHRARQREVVPEDLGPWDAQPSIESHAADHLADPRARRRLEDVREVLAGLPEVQQRIIWADVFSPDDVADSATLARELNLSAGAVRVYRKRALDAIRSEMRRRGHQVP